jgi:hypothetical protein
MLPIWLRTGHPINAYQQRLSARPSGVAARCQINEQQSYLFIDRALETWPARRQMATMSSTSNGVAPPSAEEVALLRLLTELEKAVRANRTRCTSDAVAGMAERLRTLAAELSLRRSNAVWHP